MIDLHTHIIPGLDHGPGDWDEALEMCRIAIADGITTLAATPHVSEVFPNSSQRIEAAVAELRGRLEQAGIPTRFARLPSLEGHDAFLVDIPRFDAEIRAFLA